MQGERFEQGGGWGLVLIPSSFDIMQQDHWGLGGEFLLS
jgi:hypothetical protein